MAGSEAAGAAEPAAADDPFAAPSSVLDAQSADSVTLMADALLQPVLHDDTEPEPAPALPNRRRKASFYLHHTHRRPPPASSEHRHVHRQSYGAGSP